jgi:23S rRNA (cytosine1962-C5)-methyltransferase
VTREPNPDAPSAPRVPQVRVWLTPEGDRPVRKGHPWVYASNVARTSEQPAESGLAVVWHSDRRFAALGLWDARSPLPVRILVAGEQAVIDDAWVRSRLDAALAIRTSAFGDDTTGYRLVYGESDGLPGLVIDRYGATVVVKVYTVAWQHWLDAIVDWCAALPGVANVVFRCARNVAQHPGTLPADGDVVRGVLEPGTRVPFSEDGLVFQCDPCRGQKTGFFLDQRDNRRRVGALSRGARVLNVFAYSGGFSLHAARGGARSVVSLDLSRPALAEAEANFALNAGHPEVSACAHETVAGDAFELLPGYARSGEVFDVVVIDPPAFAKESAHVERALAAYQRLTRMGAVLVREGGWLVMASCSSRVGGEAFEAAVLRAVEQSGRAVLTSERTGHPVDHPVQFEGAAYLKCLFLRLGGRSDRRR